MRSYATLHDARNALKSEMASTANDSVLLNYVRQVSLRVDRLLFPFEPVLATKVILIEPWFVSSADRTLLLPAPLLELTAVSVNGVSLSPTADVTLWPPSTAPCNRLRLADQCASWYTVACTDDLVMQCNVTGYWGMHPDYSGAWAAVDILAADVNASATSLTVMDVDGAGAEGETPRFSPGNLIVVDDEFMRVLAVNTTANTLAVRRGENGTAAAAHAATTAVSAWYWAYDVRMEVARQAALLYARRGAFEAISILNDGVYTYPPDLLTSLRNVLSVYDRWWS